MVFAIPMTWFEGEHVFYLVYTLSYLHRIVFHSYLPNLPIDLFIMLACIWLIMFVMVISKLCGVCRIQSCDPPHNLKII
jgi:hypothetical protein